MAIDLYWVAAVASVWDATAGTKWSLLDGGAGGAGPPGIGDRVHFTASSPANCAITTAAVSCASIDCTGFTHTLSGNQGMTCAGSVTWGAGMTLTYNGALTITGAGTFTSNGKTTGSAVVINAPALAVSHGDDYLGSNTYTITAATWSDGGFNGKSTTFVSNGGATRSITRTSGKTWEVTGTGGVINIANVALTYSDAGAIWKISNSSATARTVTGTSLVFGSDFNVTAGTGNFTFSSSGRRSLDFTGFTGAWLSSTDIFTGNLVLGAGMSVTQTAATTTFAATSGTQTITFNGVSLNRAVVVNCPGATCQLSDNYIASATSSINHTAGTFDPNGKDVSVGFFGSSNANTRSFLGAGVGNWTLTGLAGTNEPWNTHTTTGLTFTAPAKITCNDASATTKIFRGGGLSFNEVRFAGAGSGIFQIADANSFNKIGIDTPPHTLQFPHGLTTTVLAFDATGTSANHNTLNSTTGGSTTTVITKPSNDVVQDYLSVQDLRFTGGARWLMGAHSTDLGNNNGLRFTGLYRAPAA